MRSSSTGSPTLRVVGAGAARRAGHEEVVEAPAELLGGRLGLAPSAPAAPRCDAGASAGSTRASAPGPTRAPAAWRTARAPTSSPASPTIWVGSRRRPRLPSAVRRDDAEPAAQLVGERVDGGLDEAGVDRLGRGAIGCDRLGGVARDVDELLRHADAPLAVGDGVVELLDHRGAAVLEALDDEELPERARAVERGAHERGGEVEQLSHRPGVGQRRPAEVVVEVEVGFVTPLRRGEPAQGGDHALAQPRHLHRRPLEPAAKPLRIGGLVEQGDVGDRRAEVRILLEVPHQRLDVGHPPLVAHLSGSYRAFCHAPKGRRTGGSVTRASATPGGRWRRRRCRWRRRR